MKIKYEYSLNHADLILENNYRKERKDLLQIINSINLEQCRTKLSREKTKCGQMLYSPIRLNDDFKNLMQIYSWYANKIKIFSELNGQILANEREIDFARNRVGIELQFGKYAFLINDIFGKLQLFYDRNAIDVGISIVPTGKMASRMSTGVSTFEYVYATLENISVKPTVPVIVLGIE